MSKFDNTAAFSISLDDVLSKRVDLVSIQRSWYSVHLWPFARVSVTSSRENSKVLVESANEI